MQPAVSSWRESPLRPGHASAPAPLPSVARSGDCLRVAWSTLQNGDLISQAEAASFDALVTTDRNWKYQQNLRDRRLAVVVLLSTSWPKIQARVSAVVTAVDEAVPGSYIEVEI